MNAVVKVLALGQRGMMAGTGWFCKQAYDMTKRHFLITNAHVVANGSGGWPCSPGSIAKGRIGTWIVWTHPPLME